MDASPAAPAPGLLRPGVVVTAHAAAVLAVAAAYFGLARLGIAIGSLPGNVTPVWPPCGLAFVALLLGGARLWPAIFLGEYAVNATSLPALTAAGMGLSNALQAYVAVLLFRRLGGDAALRRVRDVVAFAVGPALLATMVSATCGVLSLYAGGIVPGERLWHTWRVWWAGDSLGALVFAPLLLAWLVRGPAGSPRAGSVPQVAAAIGLGIPAAVLAGQHLGEAYVVFPVLVFATLRWRLRGATGAIAVISTYAVLNTRAGHGAFRGETATESVWMLAGFLAMVALTGLVLAAALTERDALAVESAGLTEALRENVRELQRASAELEAFTYSVSRDLRTPVRTIDDIARRLQECGPGLDVEAQAQVTAVRRQATGMAARLDDLLAFARLQRQPLRPLPVDMGEVVAAALAQLAPARAGRAIEFSVGELPVVTGDRDLLLRAYVNLLGNAVKFTARREVAHVEVGCVDGVFHVRDDGAGFPAVYAQRMFGVFQRLHPPGEFEGSGVGLAVVERVVQRHGGRVWAEGEVGRGATVYFTSAATPRRSSRTRTRRA